MSNNPLVTTLVITYNHEKFIESCIKSLLDQTYTNQEVIISDDSSTDDTFSVILKHKDALEAKFPKVLLKRHETNLGLSGRNNMRYVSSQVSEESSYVQVLEGDDWFKPNKTETHVNYLEARPDIAAVHSDIDRYLEGGTVNLSFWKSIRMPQPSGSIYGTLIQGNRIMQCSSMIRSPLYKECFDYDLFTKHGIILGDYAGWLRISQRGKIDYLDESLACYRVHTNGTTNNPATRPQIVSDTYRLQDLSRRGVI